MSTYFLLLKKTLWKYQDTPQIRQKNVESYIKVLSCTLKNKLKIYSTHQINFKSSSDHESTLLDLGINILWNGEARAHVSFYCIRCIKQTLIKIQMFKTYTYIQSSGALDRLQSFTAEHWEGPFLSLWMLFKTQTENLCRQVDVPVSRMLLY